MDPHYRKTRGLSPKTDGYALGVVLLEVLGGRRQFDPDAPDGQKRLVLRAEKCIRERAPNSIVDLGLRGSLANDGLRIFLDITFRCLKDRPWKRPTLAEVVWRLESALTKQYTTYSSSSSVDDDIFKHFNQGVDQLMALICCICLVLVL
ncbi:putative non-specific serine/threonine protein kinase [Helianthus annuus]|nr:putative non-specific serine/threonine protein kinase [Helianthus annuus]